MRLRRCITVCALVLAMPLIGLAQGYTKVIEKVEARLDENIPLDEKGVAVASAEAEKPAATAAAMPVPTPIEIARRDATYISTYHDVYHILSEPNPCSNFFGGPLAAVEVLNNLFVELGTTRLSNTKTSLVMSGRTRSMRSARTGVSYRLFEKAVINTNGPFYQRKYSRADAFVPSVGSFEPDTREARATIVLHELGHLLQGADGHWLLPNDGSSDEQSKKNTSTIETRCGEQIKELARSKQGANRNTPEKGSKPQSLQ
jgi:hypothetical protein